MTTGADTPAAPLKRLPLGDLVAALGEKSPAPGGGAAAPVVAALGAALARMVVSFSEGKKSLAGHAALHDEALARLEALSSRALDLADDDARAYAGLNALFKLDKDDPARIEAWDDAVRAALAVPRDVLALCLELMDLLERLVGATNRMLASDLAIAAVLADAATRAAAWNVRINLPLVADRANADAIGTEADQAVQRAASMCAAIERGCAGGG